MAQVEVHLVRFHHAAHGVARRWHAEVAGPRVVVSLGKISAEVGAELPLTIDNTALQVVPDYRISGAISVRF